MVSTLAYDPLRLTALRNRITSAIDELAGLHCGDPLAASARHAIGLTRMNLEESWLGLIDGIHGSAAMTEWHEVTAGDHGAQLLGRLIADFGARTLAPHTVGEPGSGRETPMGAVLRTAVWRAGIERLLDALDGHGSLDAAVARLAVLAAGPPPSRADAELYAGLLVAVPRLLWALDHGHLNLSGEPRRRLESRLATALATQVRGAAANRPSDDLVRAAAAEPRLAALLVEHHRMFPIETLMATGRELVRHNGAGRPLPHELEVAPVLSALLVVLADSGAAARTWLADRTVLHSVATDPHLDADAVEAVLAAALGVDPGAMSDNSAADESTGAGPTGLGVLAGLIGVAQDHRLNEGARRGAARGVGAILPELGIHLDQRHSITLDTGAAGSDGIAPDRAVDLGDHREVGALMAQILDDPAAQFTLGALIGAHRSDQIDRAAEAIDRGEASDPGTAARMIGAHLADITRIIDLVTVGDHQHREFAMLEHGLHHRQVQVLLSVVGIGAALVAGPAGPLVLRANQLASLTTAEVMRSLTAGPTDPVAARLQTSLATGFTVAALGVVAHRPAVRTACGLDGVAPETWERVSDHLAIIEHGDDDAAGAAERELARLVADTPALDTYLETVRAISGEDALG